MLARSWTQGLALYQQLHENQCHINLILFFFWVHPVTRSVCILGKKYTINHVWYTKRGWGPSNLLILFTQGTLDIKDVICIHIYSEGFETSLLTFSEITSLTALLYYRQYKQHFTPGQCFMLSYMSTANSLVQITIISHLPYCNSLLIDFPDCLLLFAIYSLYCSQKDRSKEWIWLCPTIV